MLTATLVADACVVEPSISDKPGPLSTANREALAVAQKRSQVVRKASHVAAFNGWTTALFAACSAPFAPFDLLSFLVTIGLAYVAYNEFQGRKRLLKFDPSAARLLGWNQVGFLALITVYCGWMIFTGLTGEGPFAAEMAAKPELAEAMGSLEDFDGIYKLIVVSVYGTVIVLSVVFQGLTAYYYFTRRRHIEAYVRETPSWVLDVQRLTV